MTSQPTTRSAQVFQALRLAILDGAYEPGERLGLVDLSDRFGVSQSVVREALTRLSEQGLVVSLPQQGFRVVTLSDGDFADLTATRIAIEGLVLRRAIEEGGVEWESAAVAAHHRLEHAQKTGLDTPQAREDWAKAHAEFHRSLLEGCASRRLRQIAFGLRDAAELYRRWSPTTPVSRRKVVTQHRALLKAAVNRDAGEAVNILTAHLAGTQRNLAAASPPLQLSAREF